jgi:ribosomal-protein-alanine N-acetyltransferase
MNEGGSRTLSGGIAAPTKTIEHATAAACQLPRTVNLDERGDDAMTCRIEPMDERSARTIADWHYDGVYAFYDMEQDPEDLEELLDPENWPGRYFAVIDEGEDLVGFFSFDCDGDAVAVGLGLRPDLTGQGLGRPFLDAGLAFAEQRYRPAAFTLSVAMFNERAIKLYRNAGFKDAGTYLNRTNGGEYEFLRMVKRVRP